MLFKDHLVVYERENGLPKAVFYKLPPSDKSIERLENGKAIEVIDPAYSLEPAESLFSTGIFRFLYSSMRTPPSVYDYDMNTGVSVLKKVEPVSIN